jgi:hypothetical protein
MNAVPISKRTCLLVLLAITIPLEFAFAAGEEKTFFSNLDSAIQRQPSSPLNKKNLVAERYLRMIARLGIFGLYCDEGNKIGYSTRVAVLQRGSTQLEKLAEAVFGSTGAYNKFEEYRSQESLRYVRSDRVRTCELSEAQFHFFTDMTPKEFRIYLSGPPFGSL